MKEKVQNRTIAQIIKSCLFWFFPQVLCLIIIAFADVGSAYFIGKTTIFKLILGLYQQQFGSIQICGKPLVSGNISEIRSLTGYVPHEGFLFNGSIFNAIKLGNKNAEKTEIESAARKAFAHDFIMEKEKGYDTHIGEEGIKLSGGERQRIAIARAFLKDAPVLFLMKRLPLWTAIPKL